MPPKSSSRIEVDLNLLKDKNLEALQKFGADFQKSIDNLGSMLGTYSEQVSGAEQTSIRAGKLNANASRSQDTTIYGPGGTNIYTERNTRGEYVSGPPRTPYNAGITPPPGATPPQAPSPGLNPNASVPNPQDSFERQYIAAQKRIGEIPVGLRQTLGYIAEGGQATNADGYLLNPDGSLDLDENGQPQMQSRFRRFAGRTNSALFNAQAVQANIMLAQGKIQGMYASIAAPTALGQQLGRSREGGFLGTGLFSSAYMTGMAEQFKTALASDFGFNPNYTPQQAAQARQVIHNYGYSGDTADVIAEQMKQLQIHQGLTPDTVGAFIDPLLRYGSFQSGEQLINVLRAIPEAAKAATFNLNVFQQQLVETATQISQQTGMQPGQVAGALSSFSAVTGLAPSRASQLFTPQNLTIAAALTGKTMTQLVEHPSAAPEMQFGLKIFQEMTGGMSAEQLIALRKSNPDEYNHVMDGVYRLYEQNKDIFGGFSPLELLHMQIANKGRTVQHTAVDTALRGMAVQQPGSVNRMQQLLAGYGPHSKNLVKQFEEDRRNYLASHPVNNAKEMAQYRTAMHDAAMNLMGNNQRKQQRRATVEIELGPKASKFFDIMNKQTGQENTPGRNQMGSWWRRAQNWTHNSPSHILNGIEDIPGAASRVAVDVGGGVAHATEKGFESGLHSLGF